MKTEGFDSTDQLFLLIYYYRQCREAYDRGNEYKEHAEHDAGVPHRVELYLYIDIACVGVAVKHDVFAVYLFHFTAGFVEL